MDFLKWIFCRHPRMFFVRNVYGDEITVAGGRRSLWHCPDCKMYEYRRDLQREYTLEQLVQALEQLVQAPGNVMRKE